MKQIDHVYLFVSDNLEQGEEGVVGFFDGASMMPMVAIDDENKNALIEMATEMSREMGIKIKLLKFDRRHVLSMVDTSN